MFNLNTLKSVFLTVLVALAANGVLFLNLNTASADEPAAAAPAKGKEVSAKVGDTVEVKDGDTVVVTAPAVKVAVKVAEVQPTVVVVVPPPAAPAPVIVMVDNFNEATKAVEEVDTDSVVEVALRGALNPSGPAIGVGVGFSWRPSNRVRIHAGFEAAKGLLELKGAEAELMQFGFSVAATRVMTRTIEFGAFGTMSWAYRDLVKDISTSFVGIGPGFRINKAGFFFEAALPVGLGKKFASGEWELSHTIQAAIGIHF